MEPVQAVLLSHIPDPRGLWCTAFSAHYCLTAPNVNPRTKWRCSKRKRMIIGTVERRAVTASGLQSVMWGVMNSPILTGIVDCIVLGREEANRYSM